MCPTLYIPPLPIDPRLWAVHRSQNHSASSPLAVYCIVFVAFDPMKACGGCSASQIVSDICLLLENPETGLTLMAADVPVYVLLLVRASECTSLRRRGGGSDICERGQDQPGRGLRACLSHPRQLDNHCTSSYEQYLG